MHDGDPTIGVRDSTHFTSPNIGAGVVFNVIGTGLTYNISGGNFDILSGTITALEIRNLSNNNLLVSMTGLSLSAPDFDTAVGAYPVTTSLELTLQNHCVHVHGRQRPRRRGRRVFLDGVHGRRRNDTHIGGAGLDRALYTTGPIKVDMAAGTVSGAGVGIDTLVSVEFNLWHCL